MNVRSTNRKPLSGRRRGRPIVDDKRQRVLDAALKVFAERGFHGTAVPEVAEAAGVATGTLYHYFEHKHRLVNELYRETKLKLRGVLLDGLPDPDVDKPGSVKAWFDELWSRLANYAMSDPDAFRFLEMQDHVGYLDSESRQIEMSTLVPMFMVAKRVMDRVGGPRVDVVMALMWGSFVGLVKASRLGYLQVDQKAIEDTREIVWRMWAPEVEKAARGGGRKS